MELNQYQRLAATTAIYDAKFSILYPVLGLAGESGEIANKAQKVLRDHDGKFNDAHKKDLAKELGDVLWFLAIAAMDAGYSLEEIAAQNIEKLQSRAARGVLGGEGDNR